MKIRWSVLVCLSLAATSAFAQPPTLKPPAAAPMTKAQATTIKAPPALGAKRSNSFNTALRRANLPTLSVPPPPPFIKLTPAAPVSGNARISRVGASIYRGPDGEFPDGLFGIDAAPPQRTGSSIFNLAIPENPFTVLNHVPQGVLLLDFPAQGNSLYFVDCRSVTMTGGAIKFSRSGSTVSQAVSPEDGHFIYAFRTGAGTTINQSVALEFTTPGYFFGCEITKTS